MNFRPAVEADLPSIIKMISDDPLGKLRENYQDTLPEVYHQAFLNINKDPNQELIVVENKTRQIVGTMQISFIQYITYQGGIRAQIESVRVHKNYRAKGIGEEMISYAINLAKIKGAHLVQLTTDKKRPDAIIFYKKLGFIASHEGMKLHLLRNPKK